MTHTAGAVGQSPVIRVAGDLGDVRRETLLETAREGSVAVVGTGPTGIEGIEPLVLGTVDGETALLPAPGEADVRALVSALEDDSLPATESLPPAASRTSHESGAATLPVPEAGSLAVGDRRVLGPCGWIDPESSAEIQLHGADADSERVGELTVRARGRGDAADGEVAAAAWERVREADGEAVVVINGHEADHRPRGDRTLLAGAPLAVLDGAAAVAAFVGARDLFVYLDETDEQLQKRVEAAVESAADELPTTPQVVVGPDEYRAGAPTGALEAMEGADRIEPRLQPPPPSEYGLYGRPTVVHTPRTFAQVRQALAEPGHADADANDPGTRLVTVRGDVEAPATVELPTNRQLAAVLEAVTLDGQFKMACVGGALGGLTRALSVPCSGPSLRGASLGTDGVVEVLTEGRCAVAVAGERARFAVEENSGRCVPGREGTVQLTELLRAVYDGSFETGKIQELGRVMRQSANCQIGAQAPRPVLTAIEEFGSEFRAHAEGRCPSGTCTENL